MIRLEAMRVLRFAAVLAIVALLMILWAIFDSGVIPVMISMSVGQGLGTLSLLLYLAVLGTDLKRRLATPSVPPPAPSRSGGEGKGEP